jgi:hypothetical protein
MPELTYLQGYPEHLQAQVRQLIDQERLGKVLLTRYPQPHELTTDKSLYQYTLDLKNQFLRSSSPLSKVAYDNKIHVMKHALGLHTAISRIQGGKLKAKAEIRVATVFKKCAGSLSEDDRGARTGTSERKRSQQSILQPVLSYDARLSSVRIRYAHVPDASGNIR